MIQSGDLVEIYQYERRPVRIVGRSRKGNDASKGSAVGSNLVQGEQDVESTRKPPKVRLQKNARRAALDFMRLVRANLAEPIPSVFCSLTYKENVTDYDRARKDFTAFVRSANRCFGEAVPLRYICVAEFQKRGAIHFHALFWGIPSSIVRGERSSRLVASLWGQGYVDLIETDGSAKIAWYMAKYLAKSFADERLAGRRTYIASTNVARPVVSSDVVLAPHFYGVVSPDLSTVKPLQKREYDTQWLGRAIYQQYKV